MVQSRAQSRVKSRIARPVGTHNMGLFRAFAQDDRGATAIEYALIATLIAVVIIGAVTAMASNLGALFNTTASAVS